MWGESVARCKAENPPRVRQVPSHAGVIGYEIDNGERHVCNIDGGPDAVDEVPVGKPHLLTPQPNAHAGTRDILARLNISDTQRQERNAEFGRKGEPGLFTE